MEKHILFLHGALGSQGHFDPILPLVSSTLKTHRFNFYGHGGEKIPAQLIMPVLAEQIKTYIQQQVPEDAHLTIFGYSMGGYAALLLAAENSVKIDRIITLGTKFNWSPSIAEKEVMMLNPEVMEEKVPAYAQQLEKMHGKDNWKQLVLLTTGLMKDLGEKQYLQEEVFKSIRVPCKIMRGDKDKMVSLEETLQAHQQIEQSQLAILPGTPHPIEKLDPKRWAFEVLNN